MNFPKHGNSSSSPPWGDAASQKGQAADGAGHGHPEDESKEFLPKWVGFHPISTSDTPSEESKTRTKELRPLASKGCPVPSCMQQPSDSPCGEGGDAQVEAKEPDFLQCWLRADREDSSERSDCHEGELPGILAGKQAREPSNQKSDRWGMEPPDAKVPSLEHIPDGLCPVEVYRFSGLLVGRDFQHELAVLASDGKPPEQSGQHKRKHDAGKDDAYMSNDLFPFCLTTSEGRFCLV